MYIAEIITPLIFIASLGFMCAKTKWLTKIQLDGFSKFTFTMCIPAFLFIKMATASLSQHLDITFFLAFYLPVFSCYCLALALIYFFRKPYRDLRSAAGYALGSTYSNTVIIGLPILMMMYGEQAMLLIFAIVTFHSTLLFTLTSFLTVDKNESTKWFSILLKTLNNPLLIAIIGGSLFNLLGLTLPSFINESLLQLGKPAITLALFVLGASLQFYPSRKALSFITTSSLIKLMLLPSLVYITAHYVFDLPEIQLNILVLLSACPTGINAYLIATNIHSDRALKFSQNNIDTDQIVASTIAITTISAIFSLSFWLWFLS